jgi:nucleoside-diphosphate-sugar epimerase
MTGRRVALILGVGGVAGGALERHLSQQPDWEVVGVARRRPDTLSPHSAFISVDLADAPAVRAAFADLSHVTHVFYAAYTHAPTWAAQCAPNTRMLDHSLSAIETVARGLEHVCLLQGTKYYGAHLGPFLTPAREDDPRHFPPNFYYDQQDLLEQRQRGKDWSWSCLRPHTICGYAVGTPLNLIAVIGVYATLSRELGLPLRWPGKPEAFRTIYQVTDADLLGRAMAWAATEPGCKNQAFNITNGDFIRFENLWPHLARHFKMPVAAPQQINLPAFMSDKAPLWRSIQQRHALKPIPFEAIADWGYAEYAFSCSWDIMSSTLKARQFGFGDCVDTYAMFTHHLTVLAERGIIPAA